MPDPSELPPGARPIVEPADPRRLIPRHAVRADGVALYFDERWRRWILLKPKTRPGGVLRVRIREGQRVRELGLARLICRAWHGPAPLGCQPLHYPDPSPAN